MDLLIKGGRASDRQSIIDRYAADHGKHPVAVRRIAEAFDYASKHGHRRDVRAPVASIEALRRIEKLDGSQAAAIRADVLAGGWTTRALTDLEREVRATQATVSDAIKSLTIERIVERMRRVGVLPERHRLFGERSDTATQLGADRDDRETHAAADRAEWWALIVSPRVSASLLWGKPFDEFLLRIMAACAAYEHVIVFASSDVERRQLEAQLDRHAMAQHRARVSFFGWE